MRCAAATIGVLTGLLFGLAVPAAHAELFRGETSQGESVGLRTDGEGVPTRLWFKKYRIPCRGETFFRDRGSGFLEPFDRASPSLLVDADGYVIRGDQSDLKVNVSVRTRLVSPDRWKGVFRSRVKAVADGNVTNRCSGRIGFGVNSGEWTPARSRPQGASRPKRHFS